MQSNRPRPGHLTRYAQHAGMALSSASEALRRVGIDYSEPFDFVEADKRRAAARHAHRARFAKPIYVDPGESPRDPDHDPPIPPASGDGNSVVFAQHQAEKEKFRAKLAELDYLERVGKLVDREVMESEWFRLGRQVRDALHNIPARISGIVAAESDQHKVHTLLDREIRQALECLANGQDGVNVPADATQKEGLPHG